MWNTCVSIKFISVISLVVIFFTCPIVIGKVDQQQIRDDYPQAFWYSIRYMGPVGQEFTPTRRRMDAVELLVRDFDQSDGRGATLQINIRQNTISDMILGTSYSAFVPDLFSGIVHFDFNEPVSLSPGSLYVIDIDQLSGGNFGVRGFWDYEESPYPNGRVITRYGPGDYGDLWFREGLNPLGKLPKEKEPEDTDPPRTKHELSGSNPENVQVTLSASDDGSGVDYTLYSTDGGSSWWRAKTFWIDLYTTSSVQYYSVDKEGNHEVPPKEITIEKCEVQQPGNGSICKFQSDIEGNEYYIPWDSYEAEIVLTYFKINSPQEKNVVLLATANAEVELLDNLAPITPFFAHRIEIYRGSNPWSPFGKLLKTIVFSDAENHTWYFYPPRTFYELNADINWVEWKKNNQRYTVWLYLGSNTWMYQPCTSDLCAVSAYHKVVVP